MKHPIVRALTLALLTALPSAASAQIVAATEPLPSAPPAAAEELALPPEPEVPPSLAARVRATVAIVDSTTECWTERGERMEHIADRHCPA